MIIYYEVFWDIIEEGIESSITTIVGAPDFKDLKEVKALFIANCKLQFKDVIVYEFNKLEGEIKIDNDNLFSAEGEEHQRWCSVVLIIPTEPTKEYKPQFMQIK